MEGQLFSNLAGWCHMLSLPYLKCGTVLNVPIKIYAAPAVKGLICLHHPQFIGGRGRRGYHCLASCMWLHLVIPVLTLNPGSLLNPSCLTFSGYWQRHQFRLHISLTDANPDYSGSILLCCILVPRCDWRNAFMKPTQQIRDVDPMFVQCWATVYDAGPTLIQHRVNASYLLGYL